MSTRRTCTAVSLPAPASAASTSAVVGMAVEHSSRPATMAPATLAKRMVRSRAQPSRSPWTRAPPKASPAPSPLTTSTGKVSTSTRSSRGGRENPPWALLDDGQLQSPVQEGVGGPLRVGLADGDLALLGVADGDRDELERALHLGACASAASAQNIGR